MYEPKYEHDHYKLDIADMLKKLTPKENLNIPPLKYDFVYKLKDCFKDDEIIINGGIKTIDEIKNHLAKVDGVMIGRAVYHSPYFLAEIEKEIFKNENGRLQVVY